MNDGAVGLRSNRRDRYCHSAPSALPCDELCPIGTRCGHTCNADSGTQGVPAVRLTPTS
jgi:hypothetical protein